jgi:hypothetical protein
MKAKTQQFLFIVERKVMISVDLVKDIHQGDSLVTCGNEAFFLPFGAMAHKNKTKSFRCLWGQ